MSFVQYSPRKDTGIEWLGEVPEHWEVKPLKHIGSFKGGVGFPDDEQGVRDEEFPFYKVNALGQADNEGYLISTENTVSSETAARLRAFVFPPQTIVFAKVGAALLLGRIRLLREPSCIDNNMMGLIVDTPNSVGFVRHLMTILRFDLIANPGAVPSLNQGQIETIPFAFPPTDEQSVIAAFLDRETAKIDALVEEQQRLIELLKEKRQTVISHAVTKGLDPNAPMKDPGIEWLGEVPEHWRVGGIKRFCSTITDGAHVSPETEGGTYCFVSTKDVTEGGVDFDNCLQTSAASYEYLVRTGCRPLVGDVLFSKDGTIGRTVVVADKREFVVASSLIIIRPNKDQVDSFFLHCLCQSAFVRSQVDSYVKGAGLPRLSIQNLLRVIGVFPPVHEQVKIAMHLKTCLSRFDALVDEAERAISLLGERRAALISAAVTGKIDVCGLVEADAPLLEVVAA